MLGPHSRKMAGQQMPKVDMAKEFANLSESDKHFVRKLEGLNKERASDLRKMRSRNKYTALFLGTSVLGIYFYSMYAVRQEKFLDFEEVPEKKQ